MDSLAANADHSWVRDLEVDPEAEKNFPNRKTRPVKSGHYVPVLPTPLPNPRLLIFSRLMAAELGLSEADCGTDTFLDFFSGDVGAVPGMTSWSTPYALAIMGTPMVRQCPFKDGTGYGDGRAVSMGEVVVGGKRWEMQLKGGGTTPFSRGADGRAVLRSSIREFLASEAMNALGVSTTRALCLIVSESETVRRPWYSDDRGQGDDLPDVNDPRLAQFPMQMRQMLIDQLMAQVREPDVMVDEPCAISTRVAPSFLRVGHVDLFARRATEPGASEVAKRQHVAMVEHMLFREFSDVLPDAPLQERALAAMDVAADRIAAMVAGWLRVGFCQGNFNSDNCLVAGRTMDYGPFGWMDKYDPKFAKWTGSGDHFAFMNQPEAGYVNFVTLARSIIPMLDAAGQRDAAEKIDRAKVRFDAAVADTWRRKLGFARDDEVDGGAGGGTRAAAAATSVWSRLESLMMSCRGGGVDWTIAWRQLSAVLEAAADAGGGRDRGTAPPASCLEPLTLAFYGEPNLSAMEAWRMWVAEWIRALSDHAGIAPGADASDVLRAAAMRMRRENPKYVPREWMLVKAYNGAGAGDLSVLHELHRLFEAPYDEQQEMEEQYYKRTPSEFLNKGGAAFMT